MRVLTISVHPDDETLGCGGTLLRHAGAGDTLHWLLITAVHPEEYSDEQIAQQEQQVAAVQAAYPFSSLDWLKLPATRVEQQPLGLMIKEIRKVVERIHPEQVFVPTHADVHSDHRVVFDASMSVLKAFYMRELGVQRVLACEVLSETESEVDPKIRTGG